jgi:hypothetical protein
VLTTSLDNGCRHLRFAQRGLLDDTPCMLHRCYTPWLAYRGCFGCLPHCPLDSCFNIPLDSAWAQLIGPGAEPCTAACESVMEAVGRVCGAVWMYLAPTGCHPLRHAWLLRHVGKGHMLLRQQRPLPIPRRCTLQHTAMSVVPVQQQQVADKFTRIWIKWHWSNATVRFTQCWPNHTKEGADMLTGFLPLDAPDICTHTYGAFAHIHAPPMLPA